jgi:putative chitobiose transport system substrate-binding protein
LKTGFLPGVLLLKPEVEKQLSPENTARRVCLRAGLAALATGAFAAPQRARSKAVTEQISFWTMQLAPFHNEYILGVIKAFEQKNAGVTVKWVDIPWAEAERKTLASMAAGTAPDVVNLNPQFAAKLAEFDALVDPRTHLGSDVLAEYLPAAFVANQLRSVPFALPWYLTSNITLYNRALLDRAGVAVPQRWDDVLLAARAIRRSSGDYAFFPPLDGSAPLEAMVSVQGRLLSADGCRPAFTNPRGEAVFETYRTLLNESLVPRNILTEGHRSAVRQFLSGQVAMITTGMQFLSQVQKAAPSIYADTGITGPIAGRDSPPNIAAMNLAVPKSSANPDIAFAFAAFMTNADNQLAFAKRVPILPSNLKSLDAPFFKIASGDTVLDRARALSVEQVLRGVVQIPPIRNYNKLRVNYLRNLQRVMLSQVTAPNAMAEIDAVWTQLLGCSA